MQRYRSIGIIAGVLGTLPLLALLHEELIIFVASSIRAFFTSPLFFQFARHFLDSPVHTRILTETVAGIQTQGIVVASIPGRVLHQVFPTLFLDPTQVSTEAWVRAIITPDSTVLSVLITRALVEEFFIFLGALILYFGIRIRKKNSRDALQRARFGNAWDVLLGLGILVQATWSLFALTLSPTWAGLRETGIGVGFSLLLQLDPSYYDTLMDQWLPILLPLTLTLIAFAGARLSLLFFETLTHLASVSDTRYINGVTPFIVLILVLMTTLVLSYHAPLAESPQYALAQPTSFPFTPLDTPSATARTLPPTATLTPTPTHTPIVLATPPITRLIISSTVTPSPTVTRPTHVQVQRQNGKFILLVNGQPTVIKGMNYNVNYTALPEEIKRKRHQRDFRIMHDAGVNAVIGWGVYDEVTLQVAHEFGIGVFMPFELEPRGAYDNLQYRNQVRYHFQQYIKRFQHLPAVWGWNPGGDELLHRMETEEHRTTNVLQAASDFLLALSAEAYTLDPHHISIVKEPRDGYVPYIEESVRRARLNSSQPDPYTFFVFAVNVYGQPHNVATVLNTTQRHIESRVGIPLVVGEFAPFGTARRDRPSHYVAIWKSVTQASSLGGFAYVFGPDQPNPHAPNPYDPLRLLVNEFSLVDIEGKHVDDSLDALAAEWRQPSHLSLSSTH